ncbi:MAG: LexA family protein [Blastocatellales bacterium]
MPAVLTPFAPIMIRVPVYGQIAAGKPLHESPIVGWRWIRKPKNYKPNWRVCAVYINGNSLVEALIGDGDIAICRLTNELERNGQLAAVLIPEGITLKFCWFEQDGRARLESRNAAYKDRWFEGEDIRIQAVVIRIERDL